MVSVAKSGAEDPGHVVSAEGLLALRQFPDHVVDLPAQFRVARLGVHQRDRGEVVPFEESGERAARLGTRPALQRLGSLGVQAGVEPEAIESPVRTDLVENLAVDLGAVLEDPFAKANLEQGERFQRTGEGHGYESCR